MKASVVQGPYSYNIEDGDKLFKFYTDTLDSFDKSDDIIVFPEYSDVPTMVKTRDDLLKFYNKYSDILYNKAKETAKRCEAVIFLGGIFSFDKGLRNSIIAFNRNGEEVGRYFKQHLVPREMDIFGLDKDYSYEYNEPTIIEIDGIKYAFMICYDCYFYDLLPNIARYNPDVLVMSAYQRSDNHNTLEFMNKFAAYNTNTYVLRASISLGEDSQTGGSSMIVSPEGIVLADAFSKVGVFSADIDPHKRFLKPAGFGNEPAPHHKYIEKGRRPWKYRPGGSAICMDDKLMPYPRFCAHRGFNTIAPENSLPAFGAAVALGVEEIEFDLWATKDGVIVSLHDPCLDRVSDGKGFIGDQNYEDLLKLDFGSVYSEKYKGLKILTFEEILKKFSCHVVMNVHLKHIDDISPLPERTLIEIIRLIKKYDCEKYVYFMSGNPTILDQLSDLAPHIEKCAGAAEGKSLEDLVEKALEHKCGKIQLFSPYFKYNKPDYVEKAIKKAHGNNIKVNLFFSDDREEAKKYISMGVDTILTNDYQRVSF